MAKSNKSKAAVVEAAPGVREFEVVGGTPTRVRVVAADGTSYELRLQLAVLDVEMLSLTGDPVDPSLPRFNVRATFGLAVKAGEP